MGQAALSRPVPPQPAPDFLVRRLVPEDLGQVSDIFGWYAANSLATFEYSARSSAAWADLADQLDQLGLPFLVAESAGTVAGYAYATPWRRKSGYRTTVEDSIFLAPGQSGRGIGKRLLTGLIHHCAAAGSRQMIAVIADSAAEASVGLHLSCGFSQVGYLARVGYKHDRWIGTLLMQRELG